MNEENEVYEMDDEYEENDVYEDPDVAEVPRKKEIVAVDDSNIVLKTIKSVLDDNYEFHGFINGSRALEYLEQPDKTPDLIILDIEMPIMNGYDVLNRIKKLYHLKNVPVIFLTSNNLKQQVMKAVNDGVKAYVVKPVDKEVLLKKLQSLLND